MNHFAQKWGNSKEQSIFYQYRRIIAHFAMKNLKHYNTNLTKNLALVENNSIVNRVQLIRDVPNYKYKQWYICIISHKNFTGLLKIG